MQSAFVQHTTPYILIEELYMIADARHLIVAIAE